MGRAARNVEGSVVLYAEQRSDAMESAIEETRRRRRIQREFNERHGHEPRTIEKPIGETNLPGSQTDTEGVGDLEPTDREAATQLIAELEQRMQEAADDLEFELAADIRDRIRELREGFDLEDEGVPAPEEP
jgi:excinuclease ABC subunit B